MCHERKCHREHVAGRRQPDGWRVFTRPDERAVRAPSHESHACDEGFRPYRQLAVRVLARALLDLSNPDGSATDRESARVFLSGSGMLFHWCRVAALDPWRLVNHAESLTASQGPTQCATLQTLPLRG
jgi:hypothetical protein